MSTKPKAQEASRPWIDTGEFARIGGELAAQQQPAQLPRLRELLAGDEGHVRWRLTGERRPRPEGGADAFLVLELSGEVELECMRCLRPVRTGFSERRLFKLALTESQAEREDADTDDYDVLVTQRRFDVLELVEDEAILALPIAPRHQDCSLPADAGTAPAPQPDEERPNPFAALAALRTRTADERGDGQGDAAAGLEPGGNTGEAGGRRGGAAGKDGG